MKQTLAAVALSWAAAVHAGGEPVRLPGPEIELAGRLYQPTGKGPFPAIVMLHGCSGMWRKDGEPTASYAFWAEHFRDRGYVALLLDSFGPRGEKEICTQARRTISPATDRPRDAHAALAWLAARPGVDPGRIDLIGWSHGGSAVLHTVKADAPGRLETAPRFRAAVAIYPGCADLAKGAFRPTVPVLIQAGEADDWTPARHCEAVAAGAPPGSVEIDVYPGAHHGFDRVDGRVRQRPEVRNPNRPGGRGATVGPDPAAREKAIARTTAWLEARGR